MTDQEAMWENEGGSALEEMSDEEVETSEDNITAKDVLETMRNKYLGTKTRIGEQIELDVINPIELARILDIRPQQVYQAIRHGALKTTENNTQKKYIDIDEAARWTAEYLNRKLQRAANKVEATPPEA